MCCVSCEIRLKTLDSLGESPEVADPVFAAGCLNSREQAVPYPVAGETCVLIAAVFAPLDPFSAEDLVHLFTAHVDQGADYGQLLRA
jgi:hypothetical protein